MIALKNKDDDEPTNTGNDRIAPPPELNFTLPTASDFDSEPYDCSSNEIQSQLPTDILLITANDHEFNACYSYMKHVQRGYSTKLGMVDFGRFGDQNNPNVRVALMKSWQGPIEAVIAVRNAAEILHPKVVLFVGICASMERAKAKLGDVVISAKLATYDDKKFKADGTVEYRGTKSNVSKNMSRLIINAAHGWKPPLKDPKSLDVEVHPDAVMLSGSDLVNNRERGQELLDSFPDALGLEMEGAGLHAAVYDLGIEWAVIKAVSDFADGSKEKTKLWQPFASAIAASVVYNMFQYPVVLKDWRHYNAEDTIDSQKPPKKRKKKRGRSSRTNRRRMSWKESPMCSSCTSKDETQLSSDREKWPIAKIEIGCFHEICKLLDLAYCSKEPLVNALGSFDQTTAAGIKIAYEVKGGSGTAEVILGKWGSSDQENNNVGALKKILKDTMHRDDVVVEIEKWEKLSVCHGCVKRGVKISFVRRELEEKFKCDDAKEHFELLREPERKPKIKYLGLLLSKLRCKSSSVSAAPGGGVLACSNPRCTNKNPLRVPEENEKVDVPQVQGTGTLTMFCALNGQHYALTCFHVGCATDENRLNAAFNKVEDVQKMRNSLPAYESYAKKQQNYFTQDNTENDNEPILFGDDGTDCTRLGGFDNYHFDNECDIFVSESFGWR
ncbi:5 -methylthioadenosine S-adenosylhomocysteine nucleosidase [Paramuricea clavata]|uniref:5 -methylthioadenosine S-adenosylhomocysteine nucleosidase n=1 Tax=Paramuricea clavata TaxID=317549 RepID=A0A7D9HC05_PARCT|nr:5 -methylthioadenosine S-adenosylhomocysteine nucleosidase [Paramuricea clavata]